ncbi:hypothetical protein V6R21_18780 [Limibacter armeniacum]|uniref:hypothetical protein n=1 Tax=Limibacter armeniacum TaxID=466084 RepID=UPI002FE66715
MIYRISILAFFCLCFSQLFAQSGKLGQIKNEVKENKSNSSSKHDHHSYSSSNDYDENGFFVELVGDVFLGLTYNVLFHSRYETPPFLAPEVGGVAFSKYPYIADDLGRYHDRPLDIPKKVSADFSSRYFYEDDKLYGLHHELRFYPTRALSMDVKYLFFREGLDDGTSDRLDLVMMNLNYHRFRLTWLNLWWGIGYTNLKTDEGNGGFNIAVGCELYPGKPISLRTEWQFGTVAQTNVAVGTVDIGVHLNRFRLFGGLQRVKIGTVRIMGPTGGLSFFF